MTGIVSIITLVMGINPALIFVLSLRRPDAHWSVSRYDIVCGLISLAGPWLWWSYRNPIYTIASDQQFSVAPVFGTTGGTAIHLADPNFAPILTGTFSSAVTEDHSGTPVEATTSTVSFNDAVGSPRSN